MARLQVICAALLFGTTGTAQVLGPSAPSVVVGASRVVLGGALLLAFATLARRLRVGGPPALVLLAGVCVAVYQVSFFAAIADTGVAVGTVAALGSAPVWAGLLARRFAGERLDRRWAAATALAAVGVGVLILGGSSGGDVSAPGVGLALVAGAGYAGYAVAGKRMLDAGGTPEGVMAAVFAAGGLLLLPVLILGPTSELAGPGGLAMVLYIAAVPTALAYVLFARGLERIGAGETATLTLAEPLTATLLGVLVLGERPGAAAVFGGACVLAGLGLLALRSPSPRVPLRTAEAAA